MFIDFYLDLAGSWQLMIQEDCIERSTQLQSISFFRTNISRHVSNNIEYTTNFKVQNLLAFIVEVVNII